MVIPLLANQDLTPILFMPYKVVLALGKARLLFSQKLYGTSFSSNAYRVRTGFGKFRKLIIHFSRNWKVLEKERFLKVAMEKFRIFAWGNSKIS